MPWPCPACWLRAPRTKPSRERANRLSLNWAIIPELLQDAGYETYITGKWDLGLEDGYTPSTRGFDRSFVQLGASASHFPEILWDDFEPVAQPWDELSAEHRRGYARAQELYAAMVENLDFIFGRLVDFLEESGHLENTVIIFSSDNGASTAAYGVVSTAPGVHPAPPGFIDNRFENWGRPNSFVDHGRGFAEAAHAPLQGYKGAFSEGGLRAAAFVHYPAAVPGGQVNGTFMSMLDILPTFLDIAGGAHPGSGSYRGREINTILGRSFWPHLTGESADVYSSSDAVGWSRGTGGALIRGDYKIINTPAAGGMGAETPWRLYNIAEDPGERNDLAEVMPDLTNELVQEWEQNWR